MKLPLLLIGLILSAANSHAGVLGWFTEKQVGWTFVQRTGGLRIAAPTLSKGRWVLPIEYEVHGTRAVTRQPTLVNSVPHTWKAEIERDGARLHLVISKALAGKKEKLSDFREASLRGVPPGRYDVYYGPLAAPEFALGAIEIPVPEAQLSARR